MSASLKIDEKAQWNKSSKTFKLCQFWLNFPNQIIKIEFSFDFPFLRKVMKPEQQIII